MKLTRFGSATLLVAVASVYLISQGHLIPVTSTLAVMLAWLHWRAAVEARRTGQPPHGPHGVLTVVAIVGLALISVITAGEESFWLCIGSLIIYALFITPRIAAQKRRAAESVQQDWESAPDLQRYLSQHPLCRTRLGVRCFHCGSDSARDWGLISRGDSRRLHICNDCSTTLYRSSRQISGSHQPRSSPQDQATNPATGLPMMLANSGIDIAGNPYGFDLHRDNGNDDEHVRRANELWEEQGQLQDISDEIHRHTQELWEEERQMQDISDEIHRYTQESWDEHDRHMREEEQRRDAWHEQ